MDILTWLIVGLVAGVLASFVVRGGYGLLGDIVVGIIGAFIGGLIFGLLFGGGQFTLQWSIGSFIAAVIGALILLFILRAVQGRS